MLPLGWVKISKHLRIISNPPFHFSRIFNHLEYLQRNGGYRWHLFKDQPILQQQCREPGQHKVQRAQERFSPGGSDWRRASTRPPRIGTWWPTIGCNLQSMQNPDIHMYLLLSSTATIKLTVKEFGERNKMPQSCFCVPVSPLYLGGNILSRRWRLFCCVHVSPFYILGEHPDKEAEAGLAKQSGDLGGSLFPVIIGRGPRHISLISLH